MYEPKYDEQGNLIEDAHTGTLVDRKKAKRTATIGSLFDPIQGIATRASYKGGFTDWSGEGYANKLAEEAKAKYEQ